VIHRISVFFQCELENAAQVVYYCLLFINNLKTYQFKHGVKDDQIIRQKLQIPILLILEMVLHVTWNGASFDAK
jgi:hypothetical protein